MSVTSKPRTQSAVTTFFVGGSCRGEGCQPPYSIWSSILTYYRHSPQGVIDLNLLSQQVHKVSSVGAGMFPILRDTIFFYSLVILYQSGQEKSSLFFDSFFSFSKKNLHWGLLVSSHFLLFLHIMYSSYRFT